MSNRDYTSWGSIALTSKTTLWEKRLDRNDLDALMGGDGWSGVFT